MNTINNSITNPHLIFWVIYLHNKWELELETWKNDRFRIANAYAAVTQILTSQPQRLFFTWMVTYIHVGIHAKKRIRVVAQIFQQEMEITCS